MTKAEYLLEITPRKGKDYPLRVSCPETIGVNMLKVLRDEWGYCAKLYEISQEGAKKDYPESRISKILKSQEGRLHEVYLDVIACIVTNSSYE